MLPNKNRTAKESASTRDLRSYLRPAHRFLRYHASSFTALCNTLTKAGGILTAKYVRINLRCVNLPETNEKECRISGCTYVSRDNNKANAIVRSEKEAGRASFSRIQCMREPFDFRSSREEYTEHREFRSPFHGKKRRTWMGKGIFIFPRC